ncbi:MAG: hypothetical protein V4463_05145 [Pseudomonadota bacterium]
MLLQLQQLAAGLSVAQALFPFLAQVVHAIEQLAPHAPGPTKLDAAMATVQSSLTTASTDAATVTQVMSMAPALIGLAKAQYSAELAQTGAPPAAPAPVVSIPGV